MFDNDCDTKLMRDKISIIGADRSWKRFNGMHRCRSCNIGHSRSVMELCTEPSAITM